MIAIGSSGLALGNYHNPALRAGLPVAPVLSGGITATTKIQP